MTASTTTAMMPAGRSRCDNGVSTDPAAAGTWLRIRNRLASQPTVPVLGKTAETPNSAAPKAASSPAVQALGTRAGRFGHHHDSSEIIGSDPRSAMFRPPGRLTTDTARNPAATIGLHLAFD